LKNGWHTGRQITVQPRVRGERFPLTRIFVKSPGFVMPAHQAGREAGRRPVKDGATPSVVGFLAVWSTAASPASLAYILMALSALALGLQANAIRDLHVPGISTTAFTATFIDLFSGLATWSLTARSAQRLAATMVSMAAGAFLGDWMLGHARRYAPVVPVAVTAVVIAIAWVALKPRVTSGPAGEQSLPVQPAVK
jgi:uncharacterized membrane protein YoaK (UPF0700 family)